MIRIRPLLSDDLKRRRRSGRHQISNGGKHLVDGIAFGRPWLHLPGDRPALELPPRKRARITYGDEDDDDDESDAESEFDADWDSQHELLEGGDDDDDDGERASGSSFEDEHGDNDDDLMQELQLLKQDRRDISEVSSDNAGGRDDDVGFGLLPMLDSKLALRMAFPTIPSFIIEQELRKQSMDVSDAYKALAQAYGPTLSFDEMMDSVLTASRPPNTPVAARFRSLGQNSPVKRPLIEEVESVEAPATTKPVATKAAAAKPAAKKAAPKIREMPVGIEMYNDEDWEIESALQTDYSDAPLPTRGNDDDDDDEPDASFSDESSSDESSSDDSSDEDEEGDAGVPVSQPIKSIEVSDDSDSESDSDSSDSDSDSSDSDSDAAPTPKPAKETEVAPLAKPSTTQLPAAQPAQSDPGCGLSKTQKRNARRKRSKQMRNGANESEVTKDSTVDEVMADLAARKAALLSSLGSDTMQPESAPAESMTLRASNGDMPAASTTPATNGVQPAQTSAEVTPSPRRLNLNAGASKRLLFGALGLKAPKTKADEEKLKKDLMKGVKPLTNKRLVEEVEEPAAAPDAVMDDSWRDKISYRAVECCHDGIVLSEPPFPFVQRWDPQQQYSSMRKRKRQSQSYYEGYEDDSLVYDDTPVSKKKSKTRKNKDVEEHEADAADETNGFEDADPVEDLPPLPSDLTSLVTLEQSAVKAGQLITWKQLSMSKATNWQPQMASFTGVVLPGSDADQITLLLAKRDRETNDHVYDEQTGARVYEKFEAPALDDDDYAEHDDGHRTISWHEMMEPRLIPGSAPEGFVVEATDGADAPAIEVSAEKNGATSEGQPETQQSRDGGDDSASIHSAQRPHHFEMPLAEDGVMSAASDSLDTGRAFHKNREPSHDAEALGDGRRQLEAAADTVATTGTLAGKPVDGVEATNGDSTNSTGKTRKRKRKSARVNATTEVRQGEVTVVPSSVADDDERAYDALGIEVSDSMEEALIPETLVVAVPAAVREDGRPFDSFEDLFVTASSSRPSQEAAKESQLVAKELLEDAEYEEAMRILDNGEEEADKTLFPNATQPEAGGAAAPATALSEAASANAPAVRSSPRRGAKTSPARRGGRRSVSVQRAEDEGKGSQSQRAKLRSRSGERQPPS